MEFLVKAEEPWNNDISTVGMSEDQLIEHNSRTRLGDIIVVRPDGWEWGREECLPHFIVVKVPGLNPDINYEVGISEDVPDITQPGGIRSRILKRRKYQVPSVFMNKAIRDGNSVITLALSQKKLDFLEAIIEKMS